MRTEFSILRPIAFAVVIPAVALLASMQIGCTKPQAMHSASDVPAAQGTVKAALGDNGNTNVSIQVKHLAPPSKVASDATVYVVWIRAVDASDQNVGALKLNSNLEGSLETVTSHRSFRVSITPEQRSEVDKPTHEPVFTYTVERSK